MSICSTASATARRKSASPLFASSSASGSLSSVIGSVLIGQGWEPRNSTLAVRSDGPLSTTSRPASEIPPPPWTLSRACPDQQAVRGEDDSALGSNRVFTRAGPRPCENVGDRPFGRGWLPLQHAQA